VRFYRIELTNAAGEPLLPASLQSTARDREPLSSLTSQGQVNMAALQVEFDIAQAYMHAPQGQAFVRIWGLGIEAQGTAYNLNSQPGKPVNITVYGGMSRGLPLANPNQQGPLLKGMVQQAYGNWEGLNQTVDLICGPSIGSFEEPKNIIFNWKAGTTMASAIAAALTTAFPGVPQTIKISPNLILDHDQVGYHYSLTEFAETVKEFSQAIIGGSYQGVGIVYNGSTLVVSDGTQPLPAKAIAFQDLLGQPTWIKPRIISVKVVLRGDLNVDDVITLPPSLVTTTQQAMSQYQDKKTTFTGTYQITSIHHWGNSRQPSADAWNTTFEATPLVL
jgi:hypothetical protein